MNRSKRKISTDDDEERTSRGKVIAQQKGLKWTKDVPEGKDYKPVKRDDSHMAQNETGFLDIGKSEPTHAYDVGGKWKLLYTKPGSSLGPGLKPKIPPMTIFVRSWNGTIYPMDYVFPHDTIDDVQSRIEGGCNIPRKHQRLRFGNRPLSDPEETLEECEIQDQSVLDLEPMQIFVKEPNNKVKHVFVVDPFETIYDVKDKIFRKIGLPRVYQRLNFEGQLLDDDRKTLEDCGIEHEDTVVLDPMVITVRAPDGRSMDLVVNPADTIEDIKDEVEEELDIPVEDQMPAFKGTLLHDESTLSDNNINHGDVIDLQPMEIFVIETLNGQEWAYEVAPSYSIKIIKCQLEEDTGVKWKEQRLTFEGSLLKDNKSTLKESGIKHKDTLKLEPMKIKVRAIDGRTVELVVEPNDKIEDIKWQVEKALGIPIEDQLPTFRGKLVSDKSTLKDNNISHGDVIDLQPIEIYVVDLNDRKWTYVVNLTDSIETMKDRLATDTGLKPHYQRLTFNGNLLENDHSTLTNAGIRHKDTLHLIPMEIKVRAPDGRVTDLVVCPDDTVEAVKRQVKKNLGIPVEDQLPSFRGATLCDDSTLEENDINHGDVIDLQPMEIYVIDLDDERWVYTVSPSTSIKTVKDYVAKDTGLKRNQQRLSFQGTVLKSDRAALKDAGIKHQDTLRLEPMMIKVRDPDGRSIDLVVSPNHTIEAIKDQVEENLGIAVDDQLPMFRGYAIPDKSTLEDNDIRHGDVIDLEAMEIYVTDLADRKWTYGVSLADSIKSIKDRVAANTGVKRKHQRLSFEGSLLDNNKISLKDAGIKHKDTLRLEPMVIKVKDPNGNTIDLAVQPENTIDDIKRQVEDQIGIPADDQLPVFKGNPLQDNTTLEENGINHGDVIDLQPMEIFIIDLDDKDGCIRGKPLNDNSSLEQNGINHGDIVELQPMEIFVIGVDDKQWIYEVNPLDSIKSVKNKVESDTGVKRKHQRLTFHGSLLNNDKSTLKENGIKHKDILQLEPMKITVVDPNGNSIDLVVNPDDTIENVKHQVEDQIGLPAEDQLPTFRGKPLNDNKSTLEQNGINHGDVIDLQPMEIFIIDLDDKRWMHTVSPSTIIKKVKNQVESDSGVKRKHQRLSFKGSLLDNDKSTLKENGIKHRDTLKLEPMEIKVKTPDGRVADLVVNPDDTIEDVKRQVEDQLGIPAEDQLPAFRGKPFLEQNGINHGDVIDLQPMEIFIIDLDDKRWMYAVGPSTTIRTVKNQLEMDTGLKKKYLRLSFQRNVLDDDESTLKENGIKHRDTLKLEPMEIKVKALDGRVIDLVVRPEDIIESIKQQVEDQLGIPAEDQLPAFRGKPLNDNDSSLEENGINHGDVIDLEPMEVFVIDLKGKKKSYTVEPTDTVESLKYQVEEVTGVKADLQRMTLKNNLLEDDSSTLKNAGVKHRDTLKLEPFRIFVRLAGGKKIPLKVDPEVETPDDLKDMVEEREDIAPIDQILSFKGNKLVDVRPLLDYGIRHGDTVDLRLQPPPKKKSYLPDDWKEQQEDRYGNMTVTTFKLNYSGRLNESIIAGVTKDTTDFKVEKPTLRSDVTAC
eukprot:CAMPEP_0172407936 /NCGR_PEP_ID=MMETSP1061-20121228/75594_1 /TAXON_ID=37318 /ORGANISM="Pseudo-nitzschia pungens, Strain cf. pungens" /LENGTH=1565 /DNA_ID=CAMNT_0013144051 /DNA_START=56 /DNA_END=4755 /DNA_ORIENTATION=-